MLTLRIIEYLSYRLANNGIDPYVLVVFRIDPAVWELENILLPRNGKLIPDSLLPVSDVIATT